MRRFAVFGNEIALTPEARPGAGTFESVAFCRSEPIAHELANAANGTAAALLREWIALEESGLKGADFKEKLYDIIERAKGAK